MNTTKKIIISSMLSALTFVATVIIKIPSPLNGYINLGDAVVLLSGWLLSPLYAFLSAGLGSALADVYSAYFIYAPATFIIKGVMALVSYYCFQFLRKKSGVLLSRIISGGVSELIMISGYYVFEGFLYGFAPSLVNIPANAVQSTVGLIISLILIKYLKKLKQFN